MSLTISKRNNAGITVIDLSGRIVFGDETQALRGAVKEVLAGKDPNVVLNLAKVDYVDSGGIGTLVGLYTSAQATGGDFKLAAPNDKVRRVLEITRLMSILSVYPDESSAIRSFQHKASA